MLTLGVVFEALTGSGAGTYDALPLSRRVITDAVIDSRLTIPGCLFVALPGEKVDGHAFVADAFRRGAAVALVDKEVPGFDAVDLRAGKLDPAGLPSGDPKQPLHLCVRTANSLKALQTIAAVWRARLSGLRVIGITGSVGKSTTKELTANVLAARYPTLANESNLNNEIGLPLTILKITEAHRCVVLEMGFYVPGDIAFLCGIAKPQVGVLTMVGPVHLEAAGPLEVNRSHHRQNAKRNWWKRCPRTGRRFSMPTTSMCARWLRARRRKSSRTGSIPRPICGPTTSRGWGWRV